MRRSSLFVGSNEEERESAFRDRGGSCASASARRCTCLTACQFPMLSIFLSVMSSLEFGSCCVWRSGNLVVAVWIFVPDGVASAEPDPLGDGSVLLLGLGQLLLDTESLVALYGKIVVSFLML